jgi:hypothetical protein
VNRWEVGATIPVFLDTFSFPGIGQGYRAAADLIDAMGLWQSLLPNTVTFSITRTITGAKYRLMYSANCRAGEYGGANLPLPGSPLAIFVCDRYLNSQRVGATAGEKAKGATTMLNLLTRVLGIGRFSDNNAYLLLSSNNPRNPSPLSITGEQEDRRILQQDVEEIAFFYRLRGELIHAAGGGVPAQSVTVNVIRV